MDNGASKEGKSNPADGTAMSASTASRPAAAPSGGAENKPSKRVWLDLNELLLRHGAAFLTAVTVAVIGLLGQQALETRAIEETKRTQISENYRLYTQLLSNREESESALRKDIFGSILKEFLAVPKTEGGHEYIRNRLLKLEILALNFGEALSLSPLFVELDKNIRDTTYDTELSGLDKADDRKRLESLARRVSQQQMSALSTGGKSWDFEIPLDRMSGDQPYNWPRDEDIDNDGQADGEENLLISLEDIDREYSFSFSRVNVEDHSVSVEIAIQKLNRNPEEAVEWPVEQRFTLNFYNFPMVDNTRLSNDQRFALIMTRFETRAIGFSAIVFPGKYSSQRDKPFLDDVIHRLRSDALNRSRMQAEGERP